ncbi:hypothetical protein PybrP1_010280 [[Pythium] brassicae (nom. inval.)]|nr:hypothetical protein PybrP1_010280 [[Pythium] brassicae (nom. inval.)]
MKAVVFVRSLIDIVDECPNVSSLQLRTATRALGRREHDAARPGDSRRLLRELCPERVDVAVRLCNEHAAVHGHHLALVVHEDERWDARDVECAAERCRLRAVLERHGEERHFAIVLLEARGVAVS